MYVSMYLCIYVSMYVCMYVCMYLCIYVSMYLCIYVSMYLCIYVSMYLCIYVSMYLCIYVSIYLCMYTCAEVLGCRRSDGSLEKSGWGCVVMVQHYPGNLIHRVPHRFETCHDTPIQLYICYYLVKMYAARVQSTCSLLASPPCSACLLTPGSTPIVV